LNDCQASSKPKRQYKQQQVAIFHFASSFLIFAYSSKQASKQAALVASNKHV